MASCAVIVAISPHPKTITISSFLFSPFLVAARDIDSMFVNVIFLLW